VGFMKKLLVLLLISCSYNSISMAATNDDDDANYDRLDGVGASGETIQVIEWENNLEIHVQPKGSLTGLGLKLDKKNKYKPVMVISYRFNSKAPPLIRRAILGIEINETFFVYQEIINDDYDKYIISNTKLTGNKFYPIKLAPTPTQLYPDGHPLLKKQAPEKTKDKNTVTDYNEDSDDSSK
jgi:hypothetical protein